MATVITEECINCGACEPECPNTAIYQGGVEWDLDGTKHPPISADTFYIVPEKCTECVGFYDHEACAAVCPVDCCVPDPKNPETEEQLVSRARQLHPDVVLPPDFPSRFRKEGAGEAVTPEKRQAVAGATQPAAAAVPQSGAAATAPTPTPGPTRAIPKAPAPVPAPRAAAAVASASRAEAAGVSVSPAVDRVEKPAKPPVTQHSPPEAKHFAGELSDDFEELLGRLARRGSAGAGILRSTVALMVMPIVGALPHGTKKRLEDAARGETVANAAGATGLNIVFNFFFYPVVFAVAGATASARAILTLNAESLALCGLLLAAVETAWRLRHRLFGGAAPADVRLGAALYGPLLMPLIAPLTRLLSRVNPGGTVAFDGFYDRQFDEKRERQRRYGEVYRLEDLGCGYLLRFEFPRRVPASYVKEELQVADDMPDYDYELVLRNGSLVVRGRVADPKVRKIASGAPSFPPDFTTRIDLGAPVSGFKHRYRDKLLEVILLKQG